LARERDCSLDRWHLDAAGEFLVTRPDRPAGGKEHNAAYAGVAAQLRANGFSPVPLSDKRPTIAGWPAIFCERLPSLEEIEQEWSARRRGAHVMNGVGVATADGLVIIDVDADAAVERVLAILPQARNAPACVGQRGCKIFMRAEDGRNERERNITGATTGGALELLAWHRQGVIPPTLHPKSDRPYVWIDDRVTLLTVRLDELPEISDAEIDALRAAFSIASTHPVAQKRRLPRKLRPLPVKAGTAPSDDPPPGWWEASPNRAKIDELVRLFGIVHRAARDQGGRITLQAEGTDAAGNPHRPETIDIDDTQHWKHVVRIIVDELGSAEEAHWLQVEVSRGNSMLGLPGGPETYDEFGNRKFFDAVLDALTFEAKSGKPPRTLRTLHWWARMVEGRPPVPPRERTKSLVAAFHGSVARLQAAGVEPNIEAARRRAVLMLRAGSKRLAIVNEALDFIAHGGGTAWMTEIAEVAAMHGVSVRAVQGALSAAERAGILVRTRGNEGGKQILLSVPAVVQPATGGNTMNREGSPSLHSSRGACVSGTEVTAQGDATDASPEYDGRDDGWLDRPQEPPAPFGRVRRPVNAQDQQALDEFVEEARRGRCSEETLLLAGILPPGASNVLLEIVEQSRAGRKAGAKWLRRIAGEIGELIVSEPERWPWLLQGALDYVADRMERTKGRPTPCKWMRIFAENLGFIHERAGRLTPMARAAAAARLRREKSARSENQEVKPEGPQQGE